MDFYCDEIVLSIRQFRSELLNELYKFPIKVEEKWNLERKLSYLEFLKKGYPDAGIIVDVKEKNKRVILDGIERCKVIKEFWKVDIDEVEYKRIRIFELRGTNKEKLNFLRCYNFNGRSKSESELRRLIYGEYKEYIDIEKIAEIFKFFYKDVTVDFLLKILSRVTINDLLEEDDLIEEYLFKYMKNLTLNSETANKKNGYLNDLIEKKNKILLESQINISSAGNRNYNREETNMYYSGNRNYNREETNMYYSDNRNYNREETNMYYSDNRNYNREEPSMYYSDNQNYNKEETNMYSIENQSYSREENGAYYIDNRKYNEEDYITSIINQNYNEEENNYRIIESNNIDELINFLIRKVIYYIEKEMEYEVLLLGEISYLELDEIKFKYMELLNKNNFEEKINELNKGLKYISRSINIELSEKALEKDFYKHCKERGIRKNL